MIEVRQVRKRELDAMLECMTTAFGVAKEEWADGFYNGPYSDLEYKRVVVADGKVVSCLVIIPSTIYFGGTTIRMGGIGGVATLPDERRHGYAGMLMANSVHALRDLGFATSALYPFSFKYYRKFGWEFAGHCLIYSAKPSLLPSASEASLVRPFTEDDLPSVMRLYDEHYGSECGPFVRDEYHWRRHILPKAAEKWVCDNGYLLGRRYEEDGEKRFGVYEAVAATDEARRALVGFLARLDVDKVTWLTCERDLESLGLITPRAHWEEGYDPRAEIKVTPSFMFRIVDLKASLEVLTDRMDDELSIIVEDEIGVWNEPVTIKAGAVSPGVSSNWLKADVRILSQIYIGYLPPADAFSQGLIEVSGPDALTLAERLFPASEPFIPQLDEF
jgi:predicted acetyltransferase